jgi:Spy/CpxP family protein refolding chaperone
MMGHHAGGPGRMGARGDDLAFDERPLISLMLRHRQQLGLTAEQVTRLREMRSGFEKETIRAHADLRILDIELDDLLDAEQVDMAKVEAAVRKEEALRTNLRLSRIKTIEQGKALLTPEQRERLRRMVEVAPGGGPMGQGMMGPGMGPGTGPGMMGPGGRGGMMQPGTPAQRP